MCGALTFARVNSAIVLAQCNFVVGVVCGSNFVHFAVWNHIVDP